MSKVFIPTTNSGKLREFNHAFASLNIECIGNNDARYILGSAFDWNIPIEDMQTFSGNGCKKLNEALRVFPKLFDVGVNSVLVDDSGLCVSRLNYEPGVHSATYAGEPRSDQKNREFLSEMLVQRLRLSEADSEPAFFVCSLLRANPPASKWLEAPGPFLKNNQAAPMKGLRQSAKFGCKETGFLH